MSMSTEDRPVAKRANQATIDEWVSRIQAEMGEHRWGVFKIGDLLILAKEELSPSAYKKVVAGAGIKSESSTNNYVRVARNSDMRDPEVFKHLPTSVGALIAMASWKKEGMLAAVEEGVLTPEATRDELVNWRKAKEWPRQPKEPWEEDRAVFGQIIGNKRDAKDPEAERALNAFISMVNTQSENQRFLLLKSSVSNAPYRKSHTECRRYLLEGLLRQRLRSDPARFQEHCLGEVFGEFQGIRTLGFYGDWLLKLADPEYAEIRKHVPLTDDELQFLLDYRRLHEAAVEADKRAAEAQKEKAAARASEVRLLPAPA